MEGRKLQESAETVDKSGTSKNDRIIGDPDLDRAIYWYSRAGALRHNVANWMTQCISNADFIREDDESSNDLRTMAGEIKEQSLKVVSLFERINLMRNHGVSMMPVNFELFMGSVVDGDDRITGRNQGLTVGDIVIDAERLDTVIGELVANAAEAIGEGGQIQVNYGKKIDGGNEFLFVEVIDNGRGISSEKCSEVFYPGVSAKHNHVGLGLSIVYEVVTKVLQGYVVMSSREGEGSYTRVSIVIPYSTVSDDPDQSVDTARETDEKEPDVDLSGMNFVLVDDIRSVRHEVGKLIKGVNGNVVCEFSRGEDLISSLSKIPYGAIVILDNEMGRENLAGVLIARVLQEDRPDLKIVMFSGDDQVPGETLVNDGVLSAFVSKHAGNDKILEVVWRVFGRKK